MKQGIIAVLILIGLSAHAQRKQSLHDQFTGGGYGAAGCGLGSVIFGDKPGMVQIFAATTNGTSGNQTFGITSGTSNCDAFSNQARVIEFIETNKLALEKDIVRGQGETMASLEQLMKCSNPDFGIDFRSNYASHFQQGSASAKDLQAVAVRVCGG